MQLFIKLLISVYYDLITQSMGDAHYLFSMAGCVCVSISWERGCRCMLMFAFSDCR